MFDSLTALEFVPPQPLDGALGGDEVRSISINAELPNDSDVLMRKRKVSAADDGTLAFAFFFVCFFVTPFYTPFPLSFASSHILYS
jgi:hypothetical protein